MSFNKNKIKTRNEAQRLMLHTKGKNKYKLGITKVVALILQQSNLLLLQIMVFNGKKLDGE